MSVEEKSALHDEYIRVRIVEVILSLHFPEQRTEKICEGNFSNKCFFYIVRISPNLKEPKFGGYDDFINGK